MFKINISDHNLSSGSIPITWCMDKEALDILHFKGIRDPAVIIVIVPKDVYERSKEIRHVVSLKDLMAYVGFNQPGKNKIYAFINPNLELKDAKRLYLSRFGFEYDYELVSYKGNILIDNGPFSAEPLEVDVPNEAFAKDPPQWEKDWIAWALPYNNARNQCEWRSYRLFAYTLQPIVFIMNYYFRICIFLIAAFFGSRSTTFKYLLHPFTTEAIEGLSMLFESKGSVFIGRTSSKFLNYITLLFSPPIILLTTIIAYYGGLGILITVISILFALLSIIFLVYLMTIMLMRSSKEKDVTSTSLEPIKESWYVKNMPVVLCESQKTINRISDIPLKDRTLKLTLSAIKAKVCKPYAR